MEYTHIAVGTIGEPLDLRVSVEWNANERGVRVVLKDLESLEEFGAFLGQTKEPVPGATLSDAQLDHIVWQVLSPYRVIGSGWTTHPVSLAAHFGAEWGWTWTTEKFAS